MAGIPRAARYGRRSELWCRAKLNQRVTGKRISQKEENMSWAEKGQTLSEWAI